MKEYRTYTLRLFPLKEQEQLLQGLSLARNVLYNTLIDIEQDFYTSTGKIKTEFDLDKDITILRKENPIISVLNSKASQRVAKEVYSSYKSFFNLIKKDHTARPPQKIENTEVFHTVVYHQSGWVFLDNSTIKLNGIELKYKGMKTIDFTQQKIKEVKLKLRDRKYLLDLGVENDVEEKKVLEVNNKVLAIDLGIEKLATGIDNKGKVVIVPNKAQKINKYFRKEISKVQSKMDKCTKGSNRHKKLKNIKKKLYIRKNAQVKQTLHIQSNRMANMNYKTIVVGDLTVKKLMEKKDNKRKKTSRSFSETAVGTFMEYLAYKCQPRGTEVITIGEQWTTQQNCYYPKTTTQLSIGTVPADTAHA